MWVREYMRKHLVHSVGCIPMVIIIIKDASDTASIPAMQSIPQPSILEGMEAGALTRNI